MHFSDFVYSLKRPDGLFAFSGDPCGNRTRATALKGRCLNLSTKGPHGEPSATRTRDTLIKSQVLYRLS